MRFNNGIPNRLTQTAIYPGTVKFQRNILMTSFYAQDTYTRARLTLQAASVRRHRHRLPGHRRRRSGLPAHADAHLLPAGTTDEIHWKDITPRVGAAYDLFGNGKTAIKVNVGKYLTALTASNSDLDLNPLIRTTPRRRGRGTTRRSPAGDRGAATSFRTATWSPAPTASAAAWTTRTSARRSSRSPSILT